MEKRQQRSQSSISAYCDQQLEFIDGRVNCKSIWATITTLFVPDFTNEIQLTFRLNVGNVDVGDRDLVELIQQ